MSGSSTALTLEARIRELEAQVAVLREHVAALEKVQGAQGEHSVDQKLTRTKVAYDWQS